jgi:hypothetical protein
MQYHIEYHMAFFGDREKLANGQRRAGKRARNARETADDSRQPEHPATILQGSEPYGDFAGRSGEMGQAGRRYIIFTEIRTLSKSLLRFNVFTANVKLDGVRTDNRNCSRKSFL